MISVVRNHEVPCTKKNKKDTLPLSREVSRVLMALSFQELGSFRFDLLNRALESPGRIHQTLQNFHGN